MAANWQMASSYKEAKELFVRDLEGSSIWEALLIFLPLVSGIFLISEIQAFLEAIDKPPLAGWRLAAAELVLVGAGLLGPLPPGGEAAAPGLAAAAAAGALALAGVLAKALAQGRGGPDLRRAWGARRRAALLPPPDDPPPHLGLACVHHFRGLVLLATVVCVLAVDFQAFPRRYAKCETYGTGAMDLGTGLFIFVSGLCGPGARRARAPLGNARQILLLGALGLARFVTLWAVDYQEHVTEYGVHWNFFLTLAVVKLAGAAAAAGRGAPPPRSSVSSWAGAALLFAALGCYQVGLSFFSLDTFIVDGERGNLFSQNREGILGCLGYLCVSKCGEILGKDLIWNIHGKTLKSLLLQWRYSFVKATIYAVCLWTATLVCDASVQPISRRFVNLSYVLWCISMGLTLLLVPLGCNIFSSRPTRLIVLTCYSKHMLPVFFFANVMTGAVNLSMQTIYMGHISGCIVVAAYTLGTSVFAILYCKARKPEQFQALFFDKEESGNEEYFKKRR